jgi:diguanylate cyclase (GGDEF)-like protein
VPERREAHTKAERVRRQVEQSRSDERTAQLVAANEQLVLSILQAQVAFDAATLLIAQMRRMAERDALTELPNRMLMLDRFELSLALARRHETKVAVLFVDLNGFKQINDRLGHSVGDQVLRQVAKCLADAVRSSDTVSRHGGDEFLVLLSDVASVADAIATAHKIVAALEVATCIGVHNVSLTASIGISIFPDDADSVSALIDAADDAMYNAKRHGPASSVYHGDTPAELLHR